MGYFEDIETELGVDGYTTLQGDPGSEMTITYGAGPIDDWADITGLLSTPLDYEDLDVDLLDGSTVSVYGDDAELTVILLVDDGSQKWCHCFKYADGTDYAAGKTLQTPDESLRV